MLNRRGKNNVVKTFLLLLAAMMIFTSAGFKRISAEGEDEVSTVAKDGKPISSSEFTALTLTTDNYTAEPALQEYNGDYRNVGNKGLDMVKEDENGDQVTYTVRYPVVIDGDEDTKGLDYFGRHLTVQVDIRVQDEGDASGSNSWLKIWIDSPSKLVKIGTYNRIGAEVIWSVSLLDENDNIYPIDVIFGFKDPDESNYLFNTTGRTIYYSTVDSVARYYEIAQDGLYRLASADGSRYTNENASASDFNGNNYFFVDMNGAFTFRTHTFYQGAFTAPYFYSRKYNITYDLNDNDGGPKATVEPGNPSEYAVSGDDVTIPNDPVREGYVFLGWEREDDPTKDQVDAWESGDKHFIAQWKIKEYTVVYEANRPEGTKAGEDSKDVADQDKKYNETGNISDNTYTTIGYEFIGWNTQKTVTEENPGEYYDEKKEYINLPTVEGVDVKEVEGKEVVTFYAQWKPIEYVVRYDANRPEGAKADTDNVDVSDQDEVYDTPDNIKENTYTTYGYDFVRWNIKQDDEGKVYKEDEEFVNLIYADDATVEEIDGKKYVHMYAQWNPWNYYIHYDPNGGEGNIDTQKFDFEDPDMTSVTNDGRFTRKGYKFTGFRYYPDPENESVYVDLSVDEVNDFIDLLKSYGKNGSITLYAQWKKNPSMALPMTGVE